MAEMLVFDLIDASTASERFPGRGAATQRRKRPASPRSSSPLRQLLAAASTFTVVTQMDRANAGRKPSRLPAHDDQAPISCSAGVRVGPCTASGASTPPTTTTGT
jgi:hypothetical protein